MNRVAHALAGATAWLAVAPLVVDQPVQTTVAGTVLAVGMAAGRDFSPDLDQRWGRLTGGHRHLTHWPETAVVLTVVLLLVLPPAFAWPMAIGWWSHLGCDFVTGGVPLAVSGGRHRFGLHLHTGGLVERRVVTPLLVVATMVALVRLMLL